MHWVTGAFLIFLNFNGVINILRKDHSYTDSYSKKNIFHEFEKESQDWQGLA